MAALVAEGMNIYAFRNNAVMLSVGITFALLTLGFLAYGVQPLATPAGRHGRGRRKPRGQAQTTTKFPPHQARDMALDDRVDGCLLSFAVCTLVDAQDGQYRINRPTVFVGVVLGQLFLMYAALKIGSYPFVRETRRFLAILKTK